MGSDLFLFELLREDEPDRRRRKEIKSKIMIKSKWSLLSPQYKHRFMESLLAEQIRVPWDLEPCVHMNLGRNMNGMITLGFMFRPEFMR